MAPIFNQALKAGHVGFVTYKYIQCISSSLQILRNVLETFKWGGGEGFSISINDSSLKSLKFLMGGGVLYQYKWEGNKCYTLTLPLSEG